MKELSLFYRSSFYLAGFFICLSSVVYTYIRGKTKRKRNKTYISMLFCVMISALADIAGVYSELWGGFPSGVRELRFFFLSIYFFSHALLAPLLYVYMIYITGSVYLHRKYKWHFTLLMLPFVLMELLVAVNPIDYKLYYINEQLEYIRGPFIIIYYLIGAVYFGLSIIDLILRWSSVTRKRRNGLCFLLALSITGILLQFLDNSLQVEIFFESMALMCIMIFIEEDEERMDVASGLFNRNALLADLKNYIGMKQEFSVTVVHVNNEEIFEKMAGNYGYESLLGSVADYLKTIMPYYHIYRMSPQSFVLAGINMSREETESMAKKISERFESPFKNEDLEMKFKALVMHAGYPTDLLTAEEVFLMTDSPLPPDMSGYIAPEAGLARLKRSIMVEKALRRAFTEHNFEVYYQPVYFLENLSIHSAEALIRLHDSELGDIPPTEFIPIAEHDGIIDDIGSFVLEEACLFLSSGLPVEMGIEYISINLSILQCMRPGFPQYVRDIVLGYDISPSLISFEIKESAAAGDYTFLKNMIEELKAYGFRFSMDSYGTGFSDMRALYSLDFDVIKIDRSILNRATDGSVGRVVLKSCVRMIRQMHRRILCEGVETKEQIELLKKLDVDYVQGYYSSRPITKNELLGILRVTELARMEERRAIAASEAKSSFLANMSHEIRTPINAVLGMNEMILRECDEEGVRRYAKEIETAGKNLLSLINNILDYSKIEAGEMEIVEAEYDLKSALSDVIREAYKKIDQKELSFEVYISENMPAKLYGDAFRIKQIVMNILNNAVKYTAEGSVQLAVECEQYSEDEVLVKIIVEDTGTGIKAEDQSRLFEMFQRLDMEKNKTVEGTGLGLAISYNLLQMMQGEIDVESEYGVGTTFTVRLLQKIVGCEHFEPFSDEELETLRSGADDRRDFMAPDVRLLLVDDTPLNHIVIRELIRKCKMQVDSAMSGEEGLKMAKDKYYDLILMDERMAGLSGQETLRRLRESEDAVSRRVSVISMTASAYPGIREEKKAAGFEDYLEKPVDADKLSEILLQYLPESKVFYT